MDIRQYNSYLNSCQKPFAKKIRYCHSCTCYLEVQLDLFIFLKEGGKDKKENSTLAIRGIDKGTAKSDQATSRQQQKVIKNIMVSLLMNIAVLHDLNNRGRNPKKESKRW